MSSQFHNSYIILKSRTFLYAKTLLIYTAGALSGAAYTHPPSVPIFTYFCSFPCKQKHSVEHITAECFYFLHGYLL